MFEWFFTQTTNSWDEIVYVPTTAGYILLGAVLVLLLILYLCFLKKEEKRLSTLQITFCALSMALAMVLSFVKFFSLPFGGSITLLSMLFICLPGYWYGVRVGITAGVAYGLLQFVIEPVFYSLPQMLIDYPLAFGALGLCGACHRLRYGLPIGYLVGIFGRFVFAVLSGVVFFGSYAPEGMPVLLYSIIYNGSYIGLEGAITLILLVLPPVQKGMDAVKKMAHRTV